MWSQPSRLRIDHTNAQDKLEALSPHFTGQAGSLCPHFRPEDALLVLQNHDSFSLFRLAKGRP